MPFLKKGAKKQNHKYVARIGESPNYRYFYTQAEYNAYLKFQNGVGKINKFNTSLQKGLDNIKKTSTALSTDPKTYTSMGQQWLSKLMGSAKSRIDNTTKDVSNAVKTAQKGVQSIIRNKVDQTYNEVNKVKKSVVNSISNKGVAHFIDKKVDKLFGKGRTDTEEKNDTNKENKKIRDSLDEKSKKIMDSWMKETEKMLSQINKPNPKSKAELKKKDKEMSAYNDMQRVNPYYLEDYSFQYNCVYCSTAYNMRRMGYDVEADDYHFATESDEEVNTFDYQYKLYTHKNAKTDIKSRVSNFIASFSNDPNAKTKATYEALYPGSKFEFADKSSKTMTSSQISKVEKDILAQGEGARGCFTLYWANGDGHSVIYEVENNKVILRDCQSNQVVKPEDYMKLAKSVQYFRTDNEDITDKALNCVKNKSEDTTNPGKNGKAKTTAYALAEKYEKSGYKVYSVVIDGEVYEKVFISDNQCLFIDKNGRIEYGDPNKY